MNNQPVYWRMKDGKSIDIDSMDLNHLRNVLKMIVRNNQKRRTKEIELNGDIAQEFNDSQTCPNCGQMKDSFDCCGFDASKINLY